jgi:hypothetical protein
MSGTTQAFRQAISIPSVEANFGTLLGLASLTQWIECNEFEPAKIEKQLRTNQNKIDGTRGKTNRQVVRRMGTIPRKMDASAEIITWLLGLGLGNVVSSGSSDPYTHTIKHPPLCTLYPYSTSLVEGIVCAGLTSGYKSYKGVTLDSITIEGDSAGEVKITWTWKHDGSETTQSSFTWPTTLQTLTYFSGQHCTLKLYPKGGSVLDITNQLLSWKLTYNFNVVPTKVANNGLYVARYKYSKGAPNIGFEFVVSADKSDVIYGYADAETLLTMQHKLDAGTTPARSVQLDMSDIYITADEGSDDIEPTLTCKIDELDVIANTGPAIWTCKTGVAAYLQPLP